MPPTICLPLKIIKALSNFMELVQKLIRSSTPWIQSVYGKYYEPSSSGGVLQIFCSQDPLWIKCLSLKRRIIQSNVYKILPKVNQAIYNSDTICMPNIIILAQAVLHIFCSQGPLWVKCSSEKGNNSVKYWQNSGHPHHVPKLFA